MLTKQLACPGCGVKLKIAASLPEGKLIKCPKCGDALRVPGDSNGNRFSKRNGARMRKAAAPDYGDDLDEDFDERPVRRKKFRKKKKKVNRTPLIVGLVLGGVFLVGVGGILAVIWSHKNKTADVADSSKSEADAKPEPGPGARPGRQGPSGPGVASANPIGGNPKGAAGVSGQSDRGGAGSNQDFAAGKRVFTQHCARCHSVGGAGGPGQGPGGGPGGGGGGPGGRNRGPDLGAAGRDPTHTVDWLMAFIREPTSVKPRSRMPGFEGKIGEPDLRALAEYLASLK
jgi:mono/diheme cytochrome c family protein